MNIGVNFELFASFSYGKGFKGEINLVGVSIIKHCEKKGGAFAPQP